MGVCPVCAGVPACYKNHLRQQSLQISARAQPAARSFVKFLLANAHEIYGISTEVMKKEKTKKDNYLTVNYIKCQSDCLNPKLFDLKTRKKDLLLMHKKFTFMFQIVLFLIQNHKKCTFFNKKRQDICIYKKLVVSLRPILLEVRCIA